MNGSRPRPRQHRLTHSLLQPTGHWVPLCEAGAAPHTVVFPSIPPTTPAHCCCHSGPGCRATLHRARTLLPPQRVGQRLRKPIPPGLARVRARRRLGACAARAGGAAASRQRAAHMPRDLVGAPARCVRPGPKSDSRPVPRPSGTLKLSR